MALNKAMFSSKTSVWSTPQDFFDKVNNVFNFDLDVCAHPENAKCSYYFTEDINGLAQSWTGYRCWMNPPYGREIKEWVQKARREASMGALVIGLLPARTDTHWWHENVESGTAKIFIRGRLTFGNAEHAAPFPSVLVCWESPNIGCIYDSMDNVRKALSQ